MRAPNGYGTVYKLSGKRRRPWVVRVTVGYRPNDNGGLPPIVNYIGYYTTQKEAFAARDEYNKTKQPGYVPTFIELADIFEQEHFPTIKEQTQRWAKRYDTKVVSIYDVRMDASLRIKEFKEMTEEWLDFIIDCRNGKSHDYDIVIGAMADDQIYNFVSDYMDGSITREQFWVLAKFKYPTHQIAFCTESALRCLEYRECEVL